MAIRVLGLAAPAFMAVALTWPTGSVPGSQQPLSYIARMKGTNETPAHDVPGTGTATFRLTGNTLYYRIRVAHLTGTPTMAHIHVGAVGASGPPILTFPLRHAAATGVIDSGSVKLTGDLGHGVSGDSLKVLLNNGHAYVNVHSKQYPGGEIRGQIEKG